MPKLPHPLLREKLINEIMYEQKGSYFTHLPRDITDSIYPFVAHTIEQVREKDDFICLLQSPEP